MKLDHSQTAHICRGLALLLHAGIGLADGVFLLAQEESGELHKLLQNLGDRMDAGSPLSEAMEESNAFPSHASGMVRIGEETGRMEEALNALADFYEERCRTSRQIKNALAYPSMLLLLMLAVIAILLMKVLPVFDQVYASLGSRLTGVAAGLLHLGEMLENALPVLLVVLIAVVAAVLLYSLVPPFREKVTAAYQTRFGDRGIARKFNNARFARALSMGLSSGLSLEDAVESAKKLLWDIPGAAARCETCAQALSSGAGLSEAMAAADLLPPAQSRMLTVGIRGGNGDQVMEDIASRLLEDAQDALETAVSRIEPVMVMVSSFLVGLILLSVMLPLLNILSAIG